ncbi:MAG: hypothetical protein KDC04_00570 [Saprospiraceae bacterium]|nr:hypothetical protein [Saprospiraceae bacterium]MCB9310851.1 hypothetical protein [Lewinellaceae bacterium]
MDQKLYFNEKELLAFLLIYIAHVDMVFSDEEKQMIQDRVGEDCYNRMYHEYKQMSDYQAYELILSYKEVHFPTEEKKQNLLHHMQELFESDHEFNIMEKELLHFLERMM